MAKKKDRPEKGKLRIYNQEWIGEAAEKGFKRYYEALKESYPEDIRDKLDNPAFVHHNEILYYTAFEDALNTFFIGCMEDTVTELSLYVDELGKVTANLK